MRRALHLPAYRRLLVAYGLNELAYGFGSLALTVLVYRRTGSVLGAGAFFLCSQFVPALISPAVVPRVEHLRTGAILPAIYVAEGLLFALLALLVGRFALAPVLALALIDGILALTARSLARAATVTVLTGAGLLREGNALLNIAFSVSYVGGPALAGAIVASGGTVAALLAATGMFAVIAITFASAPALPSAQPERQPSGGRLRAALVLAGQTPAIRRLMTLQAAALVFFAISVPVEVALARTTLHASAAGYGLLLSTWGVGTVAGSGLYALARRWESRKLICIGAGSAGVGFVVMATAPGLAVAAIGAALGGVGNGVESISQRTALQEEVHERWMAMMMSLNDSLTQVMIGVGTALGAALAALGSPRLAFAIAGAGSLVMTAVAWIILRPSRPRTLVVEHGPSERIA